MTMVKWSLNTVNKVWNMSKLSLTSNLPKKLCFCTGSTKPHQWLKYCMFHSLKSQVQYHTFECHLSKQTVSIAASKCTWCNGKIKTRKKTQPPFIFLFAEFVDLPGYKWLQMQVGGCICSCICYIPYLSDAISHIQRCIGNRGAYMSWDCSWNKQMFSFHVASLIMIAGCKEVKSGLQQEARNCCLSAGVVYNPPLHIVRTDLQSYFDKSLQRLNFPPVGKKYMFFLFM